ncbi:MAG: hypothetical protein ABI151_12495, partial [Chitinophagaceae bacterium]
DIKSTDVQDLSGSFYSYYYNSNDTLPFKSILYEKELYNNQLSTDSFTTFHYFDNTGRNIKDSVIRQSQGNQSTTVKTYTYNTNKIFGYQTYFDPINNYSVERRDTALLDAGNNIIDSKRYGFDSATNSSELNSHSIFTYDTKQSPFSRLSNFKTFGVFTSGETLFRELPQNSNRVTQNELNSLGNGGAGNSYGYDYTNIYKANGQLNEVDTFDHPPLPNMYGKLIFIYRSL